MAGKRRKMQGTGGRSDLEGGMWTFETDAGDVYVLEGGAPDMLRVGLRVEVDGVVDDEAMGIGFGAPVLRVAGFRPVGAVH